jgi:hypothetical protein
MAWAMPSLTVVVYRALTKILPRDAAVWVDGGIVSEENDFWGAILEQLDLYQTTIDSSTRETATILGAKGSAQVGIVVAKGQIELSGSAGRKRTRGTMASRTLSSRVVALNGLRKSGIPLVVDDFHYIPRDIQGSVIRALKPLVFDGHPVVIVAIPHRRYDSVKVEREMTGRISPIPIPPWSQDELRFIPSTGFGLLNYRMRDEVIAHLTDEAIGSPHLMQDFCRSICRAQQIDVSHKPTDLLLPIERVDAVLKEVAETIGRPIFEKLARGPRQRTDRIQRRLKNGKTVDIYQLVLHALAHLRPDLITLEYEQLRAAIRDVSSESIPQLHEVARVLKHMATIAASDQSSTPVLDFEEAEKKLHVTDPFFAYYLRWGDLSS